MPASIILPVDRKELRRKNLRLGLTLGGIALAFFIGVIVKHLLLTR